MLLRNMCFFLFLTAACTVQKSSSNDGGTGSGTTQIGSGVTAQLALWKRGPQQAVDPPDYSLDSTDALNSTNITRQPVSLFDLSSDSGKLTGPNLNVYYSKTSSDGPGKDSPSLSVWRNQRVDWDTKEFKAFMLYGHGSRALRYMKELYPSLNFSVRGRALLPLHAYSSIDDNPLNTRYEINQDGRVGNILFYQEEAEPRVRFNPVDESDAVYHEFAHVFQHVLNPNVLESGGNYDVDMLLEGLADFFAASAARDDTILEYLAVNAQYLFSQNNRTGTKHRRKMSGSSLYFPRDYVGDFHLDARIVSSALNDIRKYLEGQTVNLLQNCGTSCSVRWSTTTPMNTPDAFDMANTLAHDAYREIVPDSTIVHYSERIIAAANRKTWSAQCGSSSTCKSELISEITSILKSRGIHTSNPIRCDSSGTCNPFVISGSTPELRLNTGGNLYFVPLFTNLVESDTDAVLDRCEAILAIPDISIASTVRASLYDMLFEVYDTDQKSSPLRSVTGFSSLNNIDRLTQNLPVFDPYDLEIKLWGFLLPGESIVSLAGNTSSRYYAQHQESVLSPHPNSLTSANPSPLGWALRAPANVGDIGTIEFAISVRPFEVRYAPETVYTNRSMSQKLQVGSNANSFCD